MGYMDGVKDLYRDVKEAYGDTKEFYAEHRTGVAVGGGALLGTALAGPVGGALLGGGTWYLDRDDAGTAYSEEPAQPQQQAREQPATPYDQDIDMEKLLEAQKAAQKAQQD